MINLIHYISMLIILAGNVWVMIQPITNLEKLAYVLTLNSVGIIIGLPLAFVFLKCFFQEELKIVVCQFKAVFLNKKRGENGKIQSTDE